MPEARRPRATVYIDGFNLYFRRLRRTPFMWLDLERLSALLFPAWNVTSIKYFTARVRPSTMDPQIHTRQGAYLNALALCSTIEIIEGHYLANPVPLPEARSFEQGKIRTIKVIKTEEKGSDVNLASHLLFDAFRGTFDTCAIVTNDSDLVTPIKMVDQSLGLPVTLVTTLRKRERPNRSLKSAARSLKWIRDGALAESQLPNPVIGVDGPIRKPSNWK